MFTHVVQYLMNVICWLCYR